MPPFAKFRGHRRTSTPSSPNPSNPNSLDSPAQHSSSYTRPSASSDSPFDASFPSPRLHSPSLSGPTTFSPLGQGASDISALPRWSSEEYYNVESSPQLEQPRPTSSSAAVVPRPSPAPSTPFSGTQRIKSFAPHEQSSYFFWQDGGNNGISGRAGGLSASSSERTLAEEYDGHRVSSSKAGKGRLNLLNPMSLLARRRSSQAVAQAKDEPRMTINTLPVPAMPEDYDPRIRGKIVHDFSAPRPRRNLSSDAMPIVPNQIRAQAPTVHTDTERQPEPTMSPTHHGDPKSSKSPEYAPHFKEDFGDDRASLQPASTGYLHTFASQSAIPYPDHDPPALPAFARGLPTRLPDAAAPTQKALPSLPKAQSPPASPPSNTVLSSSPPGARRLSAADPMIQASGLPKHMTSKSSRFSFDLNGVGSAAQEKLLEEKHKEKEASRNTDFNVDDADAVELDEYADYGFDEDDGLEERIPGINVDADELDELSSVPTAGLQHFHFTPSMQSTIISPTTQGSNQTSFPTPRDEYGHAIGFAMSKESPSLAQFSPHFYQQLEQRRTETLDAVQGLGISSTGDNFGKGDSMIGDLQGKGLSDEDMYFDDGDIDLGSPQQDQADFDESIFDDDTGKIRDIPAENARKFEVSYSQGPVKDDSESSPEVDVIPESGNEGKSFTQGLTENALSGLTEGNMAAFQKALESIANEATAKDQLELVANISQSSDGHRSASRNDSSHPGLVSDDSRVSQTIEPFSTKVIPDDYELEDDNIDDDLLIAEANAEALENDDEGFYGREFGFYARANPKSDNEMVNGGFFIPRGMEGVHRSHSGRANFQEPTLTPITERSEWSTRNSMASISAFGIAQSAHSLPSPALADLLGQTGLDEDLSLGALLRLRRGAWGGSQTSLHSSAPSQVSSSPQTHTSPREHVNPPISIDVPATMSSSAWSLTGSMGIPESEEEDEEGIVSPTVTQNTPRKGQQSSPSALPFTPVTTNPYSQRSERPKAHSRTSSGADSVSYVKDPDGRFIVERKRTLDSGEIELIGREVLVGNI